MEKNLNPLAFPNERPKEYIPLQNEPVFNAKKHLSLEQPAFVCSLTDLG